MSIDAYDFVLNHLYPPRWYEKRRVVLVASILLAQALLRMQRPVNLYHNLALSVLAVCADVAGLMGDTAFTNYLMRLKPEFDRRKLTFPVSETALFLPASPTLKELLFGLNTVVSLLLWLVSFFVPPVGIAAFFMRSCAMLTSIRQTQRLSITLKLIDKKRAAPHQPIAPSALAAL